jgi:hypothetical protein
MSARHEYFATTSIKGILVIESGLELSKSY